MKIRCTHCGADVPIEETTAFVKCPYCNAALIAQIRRGIEHMVIHPGLDHPALVSALRKALVLREIPDLPEDISSHLSFYPFWRFSGPSGKARLIAAAELPSSQMETLSPPKGSLKYFSEDAFEGKDVIAPEVLLEEAAARAAHPGIAQSSDPADTCLLHLPFFRVHYHCQSQPYQVWIDACEGEVFSEHWPLSVQRRKNAVLAGTAAATFLLFALEAMLLHPAWLLVAYPLSAGAVYLGIAAMLQRFGW